MPIAEFLTETLQKASDIASVAFRGLNDEQLGVLAEGADAPLAWHFGHCVTIEHRQCEAVASGSMPPLPEGFEDLHLGWPSPGDMPIAHLSGADYFAEMARQRAGTLGLLGRDSDVALGGPAPRGVESFGDPPTAGHAIAFVALHWSIHAGQGMAVRRLLGV